MKTRIAYAIAAALAAGATSLASGGSLGASQAGARLTYAINRQVAASLRTSSDVGRRGAEVAAGVRVQPIASIPVWLTAERRQRIGRFGADRLHHFGSIPPGSLASGVRRYSGRTLPGSRPAASRCSAGR